MGRTSSRCAPRTRSPWTGFPPDRTAAVPGYTQPAVPIAVITFDFDPFAPLPGDLAVLWGTVALVATFLVTLILAGVLARADRLRTDDVLFIAVGVVPGAVAGGRLGFLLLHPDAFAAGVTSLIDPGIGGLELGLAVVGGSLTGAYVASLLDAPVGRWLHLAAIPVLLVLGAGKLTMVLTGTGQGSPSDATWATAYLGPGPWGSLLPALPSVPSQAIEGVVTLAILICLTVALGLGAFGGRDGRLFFVAIALWAVGRLVVSTTWRDPAMWSGLNSGGLIAAAIAAGSLVTLVIMTARRRQRGRARPGDGHGTATGRRDEAEGRSEPG
jgi:prolipoprotein diacylglyceryltransferase